MTTEETVVTRIICSHRTDGKPPRDLYEVWLVEGVAVGRPWTARKRQRVEEWGWEQGRPLKVACPWCGRERHLAAEDVQAAALRRVGVVDIALLR